MRFALDDPDAKPLTPEAAEALRRAVLSVIDFALESGRRVKCEMPQDIYERRDGKYVRRITDDGRAFNLTVEGIPEPAAWGLNEAGAPLVIPSFGALSPVDFAVFGKLTIAVDGTDHSEDCLGYDSEAGWIEVLGDPPINGGGDLNRKRILGTVDVRPKEKLVWP